jgi:hypothetical protein
MVAATANANRREYNMATTWLPHLLTNSLSLLLPDLLRHMPSASPLSTGWREARDELGTLLDIAQQSLNRMARDNPNYAIYVAPLAIGYILSHPRFNIYKGNLAAIRVAGFGLDTLPHAATALGFAALTSDTAHAAAEIVPPDTPWTALVRWSGKHSSAFSAVALAMATLIWELGEYRVHRHELRLRGDVARINMQWSLSDTVRDIAANCAGWLAALLLRPLVRRIETEQPSTKESLQREPSRIHSGHRTSQS